VWFFGMAQATLSRRVATDCKSAAWAMTSVPQGCVFGAASRIVFHGDAHPTAHRVSESIMACLSSHDDAAFAGLLGNGRDTSEAAQESIIASLQSVPRFCEQRSEDDPSHSILPAQKALQTEADHFVSCMRTGTQSLSYGQSGLRVTEILEAPSRSIASQGNPEWTTARPALECRA